MKKDDLHMEYSSRGKYLNYLTHLNIENLLKIQ
jgi:hypothetical protein